MNLYFLVEGRQTEARVYPAWLSYLLPHYSRVPSPDAVSKNNYFLVSGEGYPRLLGTMLDNSIQDITDAGKYSYFVICLDADEESVAARTGEVLTCIRDSQVKIDGGVTPRVIVQNRTIETWCLGNRAMFQRNPSGERFRSLIQFYDVSLQDPESMGVAPGYACHAECHHDYLKEMFRERRLNYSKRDPGPVLQGSYLNQLISRVADRDLHLGTFKVLLDLCHNIYDLTAPPSVTPGI